VDHDSLPVIFIGDGAGFVYSTLGTSHQCCEDMACARAIPNLDVYSPCDATELKAVMNRSYEGGRSSYIRIGKADLGEVHDGIIEVEVPIAIGLPGAELALIATGSMVVTARDFAARVLAPVSVYSLPIITPLNRSALCAIARAHKAIVTLEEHSVFAGMGSAVCEAIAETAPCPVKRIGIDDRYSKLCGDYAYLKREHGLDDESVAEDIVKFAYGNGITIKY
jgi:transketolase